MSSMKLHGSEAANSSSKIEGKRIDNANIQPNLSKPHIILVSLIFTILQNISLSKLSNAKPTVLVLALGSVLIVSYYIFHQLPLSTELFVSKVRLIVKTVKKATIDIKFDLWVTLICILLFGWIVSIWKSSLSWCLWLVVIWIYNLTDAELEPTVILNSGSFDGGVQSGIHDSYKNSIQDPKMYLSSISYINTLEKKIDELTRKIDDLENCKIEQSILIYTFNHNLTDKLNTFEKAFQDRDRILQNNLKFLQHTFDSLRLRKRTRVAIFKLYVKQFLLLILPNRVITALRLQKTAILMACEKIRTSLGSQA